jgi:hypothetical protein
MNEIVLTHYCHKDLEPFMSISSYSEKTDEIISRLSQLKGKAYGRFRNYEWYFSQRKETEQWLYNGFIERRGIPKTTNPIYFVLGNSEYIQSCYGGDVKIYQVRLDDVPENEISFTLSDSMSIHVSGEERKVLTKKDLFEYIENQGTTLLNYITHLDKNHKYIEAQIWNNSYFAQLV